MTPSPRVSSGIILLYHRIADATRDPFGLCVPPGAFRQHMEHVQRRCAPLTLVEFAAALSTHSLPPRAVAITFDDGYLDNLSTASPILTGLDLPATFCVTTERLDEPHEFWWDALVDSVGDDETALRQIHERAMRATSLERDQQLDRWLRGRRTVSVEARHRPMTGDELDRLAAIPGHEVGAHTVSHPFLPAQPPATCQAELRDSKRTLENRLGRSVRTIAYPFGGVTPAISKLAARAGFSIGVTVDARAVRYEDDLLALPRVPIGAGLSDFSTYVDTLLSSGAAPA